MIKRVFSAGATLAMIFIASRAIIRSLPGDPLETLIAETGTNLSADLLRQELGLDLPFWASLFHDVRSQLGRSLVSGDPVLPTLFSRLLDTLLLSTCALAISVGIALIAALWAARSPRSSIRSNLIENSARLAQLAPTAWIGPLVFYTFGILIPWAEFRGSFILACLTLAVPLSGHWTRLVLLRIREEVIEPPYKVALAKGLTLSSALTRHALAPAAGALLSILGSQWGALLAGTFIVESIFDRPGLGTAWIQAVLQRDYPMIEGATFIGASSCLLGMFAGDFLQRWWDPRSHRENSQL